MSKTNKFFDLGERVRDLLEDFEVVGTIAELALITNQKGRVTTRENIHAAIVASTSGLSSIDYAKKRYCKFGKQTHANIEVAGPVAFYVQAYFSAKDYVYRMMKKLETEGKALPSNGVFGASIVLERLPYSFFSAHLLYRMGHRYEGHAVARLILEQIAWAYSAYTLDDLEKIDAIATTKSVTRLRKLLPAVGVIYGFLSDKAHIDYRNHMEFLKIQNNQNVILCTQPEFEEFATIVLELADVFGIVWEMSQIDYILSPESVSRCDYGLIINDKRPFLLEKKRLLSEFQHIPED